MRTALRRWPQIELSVSLLPRPRYIQLRKLTTHSELEHGVVFAFDDQRHLVRHFDPIAFERHEFAGMVREHSDAPVTKGRSKSAPRCRFHLLHQQPLTTRVAVNLIA